MTDQDETTNIDHNTRASELVSIFQATCRGNANKYMRAAWAELLNVPDSSAEFYEVIGALSRSLAHLKDEILVSSLRGPSREIYIGAVNSFARYLTVDGLNGATTNELRNEHDAFRLLTLLDDVLRPIANRVVPDSLLSTWEQTLDELIEAADKAFEDVTLRRFVSYQLSSLKWAVQNFEWIGVDGISRAFGATTAELVRSQSMQGAQTDQARSWYQKAKAPLVAIGIAIAASSAVVEKADNLLQHGASIYEKITDEGAAKPALGKTVPAKK